jgi:hypothetical protein
MTAEGRSPRPVRTRNSSNLLGLVRKHPVPYSDACSFSRSHAHAHACWLPCATVSSSSQSRALHSLELFTVSSSSLSSSSLSSSSQAGALHTRVERLIVVCVGISWTRTITNRAPRTRIRNGAAVRPVLIEPDRWGASCSLSLGTRRDVSAAFPCPFGAYGV